MRRAAKIDANQTEIVKAFERFGVWACKECGLQAPATARQKRKTYCSKSCMAKAYSKDLNGKQNPNFKGDMGRACKQCNKQFFSYVKGKSFCSASCYNTSRKNPEYVSCLKCGDQFEKTINRKKYCSKKCFEESRPPRKGYIPKPLEVHKKLCEQCNKEFRYSPSTNRKFCSYQCFLDNGGAQRAGDSAVKAMKKYGAKKDANHNEIFAVLQKLIPVRDLSAAGFGVPDGIGWVRGSWQLFDVKNPNSGYGKRGLNPRQKSWADDWRGGKVYLIYTIDDAVNFATGKFESLKCFPED